MKTKILITGGGGMLATALEEFYRGQGSEVSAPTYLELNVLDHQGVAGAIAALKPDYVFHTAALHVNDCEDNPEMAYKLNTWATRNLARVCQMKGSRLVYISSCGYFGDEVKYYSEYDPVVLKTVYAKSKHGGEVAAFQECENVYAIRPGLLFGGSIKQPKNFAYQRYLEGQKRPVVQSAGDKYGSPTYVADLALKINDILQADTPGLYHMTNGGGCSRAEYVTRILSACGLETKVETVDSSHFPRKANVPNCEMLNNLNLKYLGISLLPSWEDAIGRYCQLMLKEINA